jgi:hypothetical protein
MLLQTVEHVITQCPLFNEVQENFLQPINTTLSLPIIFGTEVGGLALAKFIELTQACVRPRKFPVEDHG